MRRSVRKIVAVSLLASLALFFGYVAQALDEAETARSAALLRPVMDAERTLPLQGDRRIVSRHSGTVLETVHRVYSDPPNRRRVVFREFRRDGKPADPEGWWGHFRGRGKPGGSKSEPPKGFFGGLARMAGWELPGAARAFFGRPPRRFSDLDLLARNYRVMVAGRELVAGRETEVIEVRPHRPGRPSYRLWADVQNRFPLRFEADAPEGRTLFESVYDDIAFSPVFPEGIFEKSGRENPDPFFKSIGFRKEPCSPSEAAGKVKFPVWEPGDLPGGFRRKRCDVIRARSPLPVKEGGEGEMEGLFLDFTDGAARIALVEFSSGCPLWRMIRPLLPMGSQGGDGRKVFAFSRSSGTALTMEREGTVLVLAGNLVERELMDMLRGMRRIR